MDRTRLVTRYNERPADETPIHTGELPPTPTRDRNIKATAWIEAPTSLLELGNDLPDQPVADYKRRIGPWLLWRSGPAKGAAAPVAPALRHSGTHGVVEQRLKCQLGGTDQAC